MRDSVKIERLSHAFNLEGQLFTLELPGEPLLIVQLTSYTELATEPANFSPSILTPIEALLGFEASGQITPERPNGPTALCLYLADGEPFTTLSVRVSHSNNLPTGIFYVKSYAENAALYRKLIKWAILLPVEGYEAAAVNFAGMVTAHRLNPALFELKEPQV